MSHSSFDARLLPEFSIRPVLSVPEWCEFNKHHLSFLSVKKFDSIQTNGVSHYYCSAEVDHKRQAVNLYALAENRLFKSTDVTDTSALLWSFLPGEDTTHRIYQMLDRGLSLSPSIQLYLSHAGFSLEPKTTDVLIQAPLKTFDHQNTRKAG